MLGPITKYHFIPLLLASSLFIIGESYTDKNDFEKYGKDMHITGFILSIFGLMSLIYIYLHTDLDGCKWWEILLLKKGVYSCLISLMFYYFCYVIFYVHIGNNPEETYVEKRMWIIFFYSIWIRSISFFFYIQRFGYMFYEYNYLYRAYCILL